ncbi:hypothetical protein ACJX0J_031192 [Zea mays]
MLMDEGNLCIVDLFWQHVSMNIAVFFFVVMACKYLQLPQVLDIIYSNMFSKGESACGPHEFSRQAVSDWCIERSYSEGLSSDCLLKNGLVIVLLPNILWILESLEIPKARKIKKYLNRDVLYI